VAEMVYIHVLRDRMLSVSYCFEKGILATSIRTKQDNRSQIVIKCTMLAFFVIPAVIELQLRVYDTSLPWKVKVRDSICTWGVRNIKLS
jgi:ribosomal protein S19